MKPYFFFFCLLLFACKQPEKQTITVPEKKFQTLDDFQKRSKENMKSSVLLAQIKNSHIGEEHAELSKILQKKPEQVLLLSQLKSITKEEAFVLQKWNGGWLYLNGLLFLEPEIAAILAGWPVLSNENNADFLKKEYETIRSLTKFLDTGLKPRTLALDQLESLSLESAKKMGQWRGRNLSLNGLTQLSSAVTEALCQWPGERLYLNGVTRLDPDTIKQLAQWNGYRLYLNGVTTLTPELAELLIQWPGYWLSLNGINKIDFATLKILCQWQGYELHLNGLNKMSDNLAQELVKWPGYQLHLTGIQSFEKKSIQTLAQWRGRFLVVSLKVKNALAKQQLKTSFQILTQTSKL